jgi:RND family efflux transporter MFP subunit
VANLWHRTLICGSLPRMKRVFLWAGGLLVLVIAVVAAYAFTHSSTTGVAAGGTARATKQPMEVLVKSQGLIVAATTIEVKSRASGYVQAVHVRAGDRVKKDQILVEVDPSRSRLNEEEARNEVENARSQVKLSEEARDTERVALLRRRLERQKQLMERGLIKREDLETAEFDLASAERSVRTQQKQLEGANARLETALTKLRRAETESTFTTIRSPIDGIVMLRAVEVGSGVTSFSDSVQGGTVLFKIGSLDRPAFEGTLAVSDLTKVKPGVAARITSDAWTSGATGVVSYVGQEAQTEDRTKAATFAVRIQLETTADDRPLNVPALAEIIVSSATDAIVLPMSCIQYKADGTAFVREMQGPGGRELVVQLGPVKDGKVQVTGDLADGTEVFGCGGRNAVRS